MLSGFGTPATRISVRYGGRKVDLSVRFRSGGEKSMVFLHGLGCAKEAFDAAFESPDLAGFSLCALDFPGHGGSQPLLSARHSIEAYADITRQAVEKISLSRIFVVGHSLGGAVGLVACAGLDNLAHFVSVEGNLVAQDCGLVSRSLAAQPVEEFRTSGFAEFLHGLRDSARRDLRVWAEWFASGDPTAIHQAAGSLVGWSDSGKLMEIFAGLPQKSYIYGDQDDRLGYLLPTLRCIPQRAILGADHFPMVDEPAAFYRALAELCGETGF